MSEHLEAAMNQFRQGRRRKYGPYDVTKPPTDEELAGQTPEQREDFSLFSPQQLEQETRTVRLDISFGDVVKIRDQCEMIMSACRIIMEKTRQHDIGSERQRVDCRREAASLGRALTRFNGKTPYGDSKKKTRSY
ncbi:MAG TPA: hypothetical protein VGE09_08275 [Pseudoxanthomonas sp.]